MITQTVTVTDRNAQNIIVGRRGTYNAEQIAFDISSLISDFGDGSAVLMVKRPVDESAYPATVERDGDTLLWTISEVDTSYKGHGECELFWYVDDGLAKSIIWSLTILRDIGTTTEDPPDPYESWVDTLVELGAETLENARRAAESEANAKESELNAGESERNAETSAENASTSEANARNNALKSEGYAVGEQEGAEVGADSPYYQNNAKFYANVAQQGAEESGYAWFDVNDEDGEMYVTITANLAEDVSFSVNESLGILEVSVNG